MAESSATCWTMIEGAAAGRRRDRDQFAKRYSDVIRAYLGARWRGSPLMGDLEDAAQDVFVECFREDGALDRADPKKGDFRAFLYGVVRNVARRIEERYAKRREHNEESRVHLSRIASREDKLSTIFDQNWAVALLRQATELQADRARTQGARALRRVDLLRLRFQEGLPIREISKRWNVDADELHRDYAKARDDFKAALRGVVAEHMSPLATPREVDEECAKMVQYFR